MIPAEPPGAPAPQAVARALAELRRLIPEGGERAIVAAMTTLADHGDQAALLACEALLAEAPLSVYYGDRDADPLPWELSPRVFALLAAWWERLGLAGERGGRLASDWLGERPPAERHFGGNSFTLFTRAARHVAPHVAPPLIAACAAGRAELRARAADGLKYAPTGEAIDALVALLGDGVGRVADTARFALNLLAYPPSAGSSRHTPAAPDAVAPRLAAALASPSAAVRRRALAALAWFAGVQHRNSIVLPPQFARVLQAIVPLLADPDPEVQRLAAERIGAAGYHLDMLRPSRAAALGLRLPALDLLTLLDHPDPGVVRAALSLAGRAGDPAQERGALAARILAMLDGLRGDPFAYPAALYALGRLEAAEAIPAIARHLQGPEALGHVHALLVLARLRHGSVAPHLARLLGDLTYREDAREALEQLDAAEALPQVLARLRERERAGRGAFQPAPAEIGYLEARGDAEALALLRRSEAYRFAARLCGAEREPTVAAARRLERRLLLASGLSPEAIDDPVATVRRILAGPLHPSEHEPPGREAPGEAAHAEQRARWRNLCVAIDAWLLADPQPPLGPALDEAERLLAAFPDEAREAHERWWLDVTRGGQLGLPRVSAVARARLSPRAPWRLARALVVNEGIAGALDPAATFAWDGLERISVLAVDHVGWLRALPGAPARLAPQVLRAGIYDDRVAAALQAWPGLERLERLEVLWSRGLSDGALAGLRARTLAARRQRAWRTPAGTYLVPRRFDPVHDSSGRWIARADGSVLAVGATYAEVTRAGELLRTYGGPSAYGSPEEWAIGQIFDVVGGALRRYFWYEDDRPAPGSLDEVVVMEGLAPVDLAALPPAVAGAGPRR